jgi:hypothetical protein
MLIILFMPEIHRQTRPPKSLLECCVDLPTRTINVLPYGQRLARLLSCLAQSGGNLQSASRYSERLRQRRVSRKRRAQALPTRSVSPGDGLARQDSPPGRGFFILVMNNDLKISAKSRQKASW